MGELSDGWLVFVGFVVPPCMQIAGKETKFGSMKALAAQRLSLDADKGLCQTLDAVRQHRWHVGASSSTAGPLRCSIAARHGDSRMDPRRAGERNLVFLRHPAAV